MIAFKADKVAPNDIFQFVRGAQEGKITDEEIQQMIDDVGENE